MSRVCEMCARGPKRGNRRSKSMIETPRKVHINLQSKRIDGKKMRICTSCMRTRTKQASAQ